MHSKEKMAWNKDGALHAQVDCHCPVPRVIPAAISAPILWIMFSMAHLREPGCVCPLQYGLTY